MIGGAGELIAERGDRLASLVRLEMGKLIGESGQEADLSSETLRYYGEEGPRIAASRPLVTDAGDAVLDQGFGGRAAWRRAVHYPLYQVVRLAAPNLVLGNTILLKHGGICPQSALALEELFRDAGAPEGVYANLFIATEDVPHVIESPTVQGVADRQRRRGQRRRPRGGALRQEERAGDRRQRPLHRARR